MVVSRGYLRRSFQRLFSHATATAHREGIMEIAATTTVEREALSIDEAAAAAGLGRTMLYELLARGEGPTTIRVGRRRLVRVQALRDWLAGREGRS